MCGIVGFYKNNPKKLTDDKNILINMCHALEHRGPDSFGFWIDSDKKIHFGHRRLAIQDLSSNGNQPMVSLDGRYAIIFNGEIYNHLDIRKELLKDVLKWNGVSDTETLLRLVERFGFDKSLSCLNGMFSIAVFDNFSRKLYLARDRFGEKPLYYGWFDQYDKNYFGFASELKALNKHPEFNPSIDKDSLNLFLKFNNVPGENCIFDGIKKVPAGSFLELDTKNHQIKINQYWSLSNFASEKIKIEDDEALEKFNELFSNSIKNQMISDVPIGAFLSGGIDSSRVVATMQKLSSKNIQTFTMGFEERQHDESLYARKISNFLGTDHTEVIVSESEAKDVIPLLPEIYDEPFADSSQIPTYLVSKIAKEKVTVCLSGDGGDELFGGYNRYKYLNLSKNFNNISFPLRLFLSKILLNIPRSQYDLFKGFLNETKDIENFGDKVHKLARTIKIKDFVEKYEDIVSHWKYPEKITSHNEKPYLKEKFFNVNEHLSDVEKFMMLDSLNYLTDDILVKVDRAAMAVSLETRVPFLDHNLQEFIWSLPERFKIRQVENKRINKWLLKKSLYEDLPKSFFERPKKGFEIPVNEWIKGSLRDWAEDLLCEKKIKENGFFNYEEIKKSWNLHLKGKVDMKSQIWPILMFQSWYEGFKN
jgi:asparagine synthase (glutamine-hydrolysing)|tara:strand:+ start:8150 stop:10093 length:1944 start_codon:yes stop_codon:yes gene_type:complete